LQVVSCGLQVVVGWVRGSRLAVRSGYEVCGCGFGGGEGGVRCAFSVVRCGLVARRWLGGWVFFEFWGSTNAGVLRCAQNDSVGSGGCVFGGLGLGCGGEAFLGGEVVGGELDGVEDEAGTAFVDRLVGDAGRDFADGLLDGGAIVGTGEVELVVRYDEAKGRAVVLVVEAEELVVDGVAAAAAVGLGPVRALVRFVWVTIGAVAVDHRSPPRGVFG
jgi:hypothetical protein